MALANRPVIWSAQTLTALRAATVYGNPGVVNRDFQGEITQAGDRVAVTGIVDPTIFDITPNSDIPAPETLTDSEAELVIDQNKGFNFQVDDLDQMQVRGGRGLILKSAQNAGQALSLAADQVIATKMVAAVPGGNTIGSSGTPLTVDAPLPGAAVTAGATYAYNVLARLAVKLEKANVPDQGRWVVVPPFFAAALALDPRFTASDSSGLRTSGFQGTAAGFRVYTTSAVPVTSGKYKVLAGSPIATSYAEQLVQVKFYEPERRFANAAKGQHVYGAKVFYPNALAMAWVSDVSGLDA